jgi:cephalosporin hydroxylase
MWKECFGSGAKIIGLDINPECKNHEQNSIEIFTGSQDDPSIIAEIFDKYPRIDIVLDAASHINDHMRRSRKVREIY